MALASMVVWREACGAKGTKSRAKEDQQRVLATAAAMPENHRLGGPPNREMMLWLGLLECCCVFMRAVCAVVMNMEICVV